MQRSQARSLTLIAQISTMGLVALIALVAVAGVPGLSSPAVAIPPMPEPKAIGRGPSEGTQLQLAQRIELDPIIDRFKSLPNAPRVIEPDTPDKTGEGDRTPPAKSLVAFMGAVIATNHRAAMLRTDDEKVWVAQGQTGSVGGRSVRVLEVQADHVRVEIDGAERRLARAPRSGSAVASVARTPERMGGNTNVDFSARRKGIEDARTEMLRSGGQDPLEARRNSANAMLERAAEIPQAAERLRERAERLLSINPSNAGTVGGAGSAGGAGDPER